MDIALDLAAFKQTSLKLSGNASHLASGGQALTVADRGTIVKLYYAAGSQPTSLIRDTAYREWDVLNWASTLGLPGIKTPKPRELFNFERPVEFRKSSSNCPAVTARIITALRMDKLPGTRPDPSQPSYDIDGFYGNLGEVMAQFHQSAARRPPPFELPDTASESVAFLHRTLDTSSAWISRPQREWLLSQHQASSAAGEPQLLHRDFHPRNTLTGPKKNSITGLLDFGCAEMGLPAYDVADHARFLDDPQQARKHAALLRGYESVAGYIPDQAATATFNLITAAVWVLSFEMNYWTTSLAFLKQDRLAQFIVPQYEAALLRHYALTGIKPPDPLPARQLPSVGYS